MLWIIIISFQLIQVQPIPEVTLTKDTLPQEVNPGNALYIDSCSKVANRKLSPEKWRLELNTMKQSIRHNNCYNPGAVFSFIDMMISKKATEHFEFAEEIYNRSLQNTRNNLSELQHIQKEAKNLLPLLSNDKKKEWEQKIELNDPTLADEIQKFWRVRDPVFTTPANERLREHWLRIANARKEFTKNKDGIYETDDRGTIYIKLGPPTFKRSGMLTLNSTEIRSKLYDISFFKGAMSQREIFSLNLSIKQQHVPRYYEVWVYRNLNTNRPILYIFGESANKGTFGMRKSVEEFIDSGSNSMGLTSSYRFDTGPRGLTAAPFIQMALYNKLSTIDIYFGRQLTHYDQNWLKYLNDNMNFSSLKTLNNSWKAERELSKIQEKAPQTRSEVEERLDLINQDYKIYRFLDDGNKPITKVLIFGAPEDNVLPRDANVHQFQSPTYRLAHALRVFDESGNQIIADKANIPLQENNNTTYNRSAMLEMPASVFNYQPDRHTIILSSEIHRMQTITNNKETSVNITVIASKNESIVPSNSLNKDSDSLEVSDIIWGFKDENQLNRVNDLPFIVPKDEILPSGKNLSVYFETYHLKPSDENLFNYRVEYSIKRKKRRKYMDTGIRLTLNLSSANETAREEIEIKTEDLDPGKYRAVFKFSAPYNPSHVKERYIEFEVQD